MAQVAMMLWLRRVLAHAVRSVASDQMRPVAGTDKPFSGIGDQAAGFIRSCDAIRFEIRDRDPAATPMHRSWVP